MPELTIPFIKTLVLINLLSFGRYFGYFFIPIFSDAIMEQLNHTSPDSTSQLLEWYQWPNMILSVICGFLMDNLLGLRASLFTFSLIGLVGYICFIVSFSVQSFWLCATSQVLLGIGYETIFIIQLAYCGRHFIYGRIYTVVGVLFSVCFFSIFLGKVFMPLIFRGFQEDVTKTAATVLIAHLISFGSAMWLIFFSEIDGSNPPEDYVLQKYFKPNLFIISSTFILYYCPNLQFWADFKESLRWKYGPTDGIIYLFFATTSIAMPIFGFLLDMTGQKLKHLLWSLVVLFVCHCLLTFTYINPWVLIFIVAVAHSLSQLVIWVFLLSIVPKNEYATAMGFLQSFENLTFAMSSHIKPIIIETCGLFFQGLINCICIVIAYAAAQILWYLN